MLSRANLKVKLGEEGEDLAATYLRNLGFSIQERRFRSRFGEIDIVARKKKEFFFIEVKTRKNLEWGAPVESMPYFRVERLKKMALFYAVKKKIADKNLHLSLLGIDLSNPEPKIEFIQDIL